LRAIQVRTGSWPCGSSEPCCARGQSDQPEAAKVFTRRGNDWTNRFRKIAADAWHINAGSAIIDGEAVAPAAELMAEIEYRAKSAEGKVR
jgi:ATP-dependent DNA ligase